MPIPKRYFHCSQELNHDAEMWEFTKTFGDRSLRTWLQILVFLDRSENQWRVSGDWLGTLSRMVRQSSANCSRQVRWMVEKQWLQATETSSDGSPLVFSASNWRKYNRTREHKGGELGTQDGTQKERIETPSFPTPTPTPSPTPTPTPKKKKELRVVETASSRPPGKSVETWEAYRKAYAKRYGVDPVRNQPVNIMLCKLVDKLGDQDAPFVAAFFVTHNAQWYVQKMHPVNILLQDAEKLRTEWATNRKVMNSQAVQIDKTAGRMTVFQELIDERKKESEVINVESA